ncbi:heavy metal translocating P-type ATPase [Chelatococcus sp. SYSU_G07232]|uniref:P-type Zn(2+) transporter n=1 Tax=Chelatococcus albus TaxID=3047466 RepID=A0ABT7AH24_9HYPH|nr:heavy metal translocating P-type ATPase [Chelatococcus sp. SYSU_G07232]MDJ1158669.1 heavy metal translocating P-type ATPase [Chelatococcus sp. SYSU_G07232]
MTAIVRPARAPQVRDLAWKIEGMDCPSCAGKIRGALERLPGVSAVRVTYTSETLSLRAGDGASAEAIERQVRALGYVPTRLQRAQDAPSEAAHEVDLCGRGPGHDHGHDHGAGCTHDHGQAQAARVVAVSSPVIGAVEGGERPARAAAGEVRRWWQTAKGRLVLLSGALLGIAFLSEFTVPQASAWAFGAAALIAAAPVARRALAALRAHVPFTMELLMTIAVAGALVIGAVEEAALVVFLFAVGELLEGVAARRARASISALAALVPKTALVEENGTTHEIEAAMLVVGQTVLVRAGDRIPADGSVVEGASSVDEAPVTGESVPKAKGVGDAVFAGSINKDGVLRVVVEKAAADNTIARIISLVEEAQEARAPTERFIDGFSRWYMPMIACAAVLVAVLPPLALGGEWGTWTYRALALLLIGCPCALVISVPASIASALSAGARSGLLLKGGVVLEQAARISLVAFDKTGTLTEGRPRVTDIVTFGRSEAEALALAASVENGSSHPIAAAILQRAGDAAVDLESASAIVALPGKGIEGDVGGVRVFLGSPRHAAERAPFDGPVAAAAERLEGEGKTLSVLVVDGAVTALIALRDEPRPDARGAIAELAALGVDAVMLSGDNTRTASAIGGALGLRAEGELMPDDKVAQVRRLAETRVVAMVGDGINDAPALAAATIGVAMGSGTDVALETADAALMCSRVADVPRLLRLARATMANVRENIVVALGLKLVFLVTSVAGVTGLWMAILADTGATVIVTANALRLLRFGRRDGVWQRSPEGQAGIKLPHSSAA